MPTQLTYDGPAVWNASGPLGGPFENPSRVIVLRNPGTEPAPWWPTSVPSFAALDRSYGVIQPGSSQLVRVSVVPGIAQSLPPGTYVQDLTIHGPGAVRGDIVIDCTLSVLGGGADSSLTPASDFFTQGAASGPFLPESVVYTLENTGSTTLEWEATPPVPWISVVPAQSQLPPATSIDVTVSILTPMTAALPVGRHSVVVDFEVTGGTAILQSRVVTLSVLTDSATGGWTEFTASPDTRIVYVSSSSGDDGNDGLSPTAPKQTIPAGLALLRDGFPDWLLLRRGDVWDSSLGEPGKSGRSPSERMLVGSYGPSDVRPLLRTGTGDGMLVLAGAPCNDFAVVGLHFWANTYTGSPELPRGIGVFGAVRHFLIEDCRVEGYETNLVIQGDSQFPAPSGRHQDIAIRRCVILDAFSTSTSNANGIFASGTDTLILEENLFDRNGWRDDVPGSEPTWFRHNIYIQNLNTGVLCRGNIVARTDGLHTRSGGLVEGNLLLRNALGLVLGGGGFPEIEADGVAVTARNNVVLDGNDLQAGSPRGWGVHLSNLREGRVDSNVFAHNTSGHAPFPAIFAAATNAKGVEETVFSNNVVYAWDGSSAFEATGLQTDVHLANNRFQNLVTQDQLVVHWDFSSIQGVRSSDNEFYSIAPVSEWMLVNGPISLPHWKSLVHDSSSQAHQTPFPDPSRTIATYHANIGGAPSLDDFISEARKQSRLTWRTQYTAEAVNQYIRAGLGL